jgi:ubiquinone/menaquinone biosynthesis C-methylase UbiE
MDETMQKVKADFDRIALLSSEDANQNNHYLNFLLQHIPPALADALEIGCGTGGFSRLLAERSDRVLALDFAPNMIRLARARSREYPNIDFQCEDVTRREFPAERFNCIASIATLHHLPMKMMLLKMKDALKEGGTLVVLDLFQADGALDAVANVLAMPVSMGLRFLKTGKLRASREVRAAWDAHGRSDTYLTLSEIRELCALMLPGARVRQHLLWRYSIIWKKPASS